MQNIRSKSIDRLFEIILGLENIEDCYSFFEDVCTIAEIRSIAQRMEVAVMLRNGVTYQKIAAETGASSATISRVNRALTYGAEGYTRVLDTLENRQEAE